MTRRHEQIEHRRKLSEIRNIMYSMKTLAIMETHKLERTIKSQSRMAASIENIAADFLHFNPQVLPDAKPVSNIVLLIGSEHGFCGDFNQQLREQLEQSNADYRQNNTTLISVGSKLHPLLSETGYNIINVGGAIVVEEIPGIVSTLAEKLSNHEQPATLFAIHHNDQHGEIISERLLPPFEDIDYDKTNVRNPPLLNLSSTDFFLELADHYLFSSLHRILYVSLMLENQRRIQHLESATHHLDEKTEELKHKINALRQEEIIEEIEVILLNESSSTR